MDNPEKILERVEGLALEHFRGDMAKVRAWLSTPNYMFGGWAPEVLIGLGRGNTVLRYVKDALAENER